MPRGQRKVRVWVTAISAVWMVAGWPTGSLCQDRDTEIRVARLIEQLSARSYATREAAHDELAEIGTAGQAQLEEAARSPDPEVHLRAERILRRLRIEALWQGSPIRLGAKSLSVSQAVRIITAQTGNRILTGDEYSTFHETSVRFDRAQGTFWPAVDDLCRKSGNLIRPQYGTRRNGLVLVLGEPGDFPVAYAGPLRARITSARRVFVEELDYEGPKSETQHSFQLQLSMSWEEQFRLVAYRAQPEIVEAVAEDGAKILDALTASDGWQVIDSVKRQMPMTLKLRPPPRAAKRLARLTLRWGLIAVGHMDVLEIDINQTGTIHRRAELRVIVNRVEHPSDSHCHVVVTVARDLIVPQPDEVLYRENEFELIDESGKPFVLQSTEKLGISSGAAKIKLKFSAPSAESKPVRLRVRYPRIRDQRDVEIVFKNVPLPVAAPE